MPEFGSMLQSLRAKPNTIRKSRFGVLSRSGTEGTTLHVTKPKKIYFYSLRRSKRVHTLVRRLTRGQLNKSIQSTSSHPHAAQTERTVQQASIRMSTPSLVQVSPSQKRLTIHQGPSFVSEAKVSRPKHKSLRFSHPTVLGMIPPALPSASTGKHTGRGSESEQLLEANSLAETSSFTSKEDGLTGVNPVAVRRSYLATMEQTSQEPESETRTLNRLDGTSRGPIRRENLPSQLSKRQRESGARPPTLGYLSKTPSIGGALTQALHECEGDGAPVVQDSQYALDVLACQKETKPDLSDVPRWLQDQFGPSGSVTTSLRDSTYPGKVPYRASYLAHDPARGSMTHSKTIRGPSISTQQAPVFEPAVEFGTTTIRAHKGKRAADSHIADNLDQIRGLEHLETAQRQQRNHLPAAPPSPPISDYLPAALCPSGHRISRKPVRTSRLNHDLPSLPLTEPPRKPWPAPPRSLSNTNVSHATEQAGTKNMATVAAQAASLKHERSYNPAKSAQSPKAHANCGCNCDCNHCYAAHLYARLAASSRNERSSGTCHCDCVPCLAAHVPHRVPGLMAKVSATERPRKRDFLAALAAKDIDGMQKYRMGTR